MSKIKSLKAEANRLTADYSRHLGGEKDFGTEEHMETSTKKSRKNIDTIRGYKGDRVGNGQEYRLKMVCIAQGTLWNSRGAEREACADIMLHRLSPRHQDFVMTGVRRFLSRKEYRRTPRDPQES